MVTFDSLLQALYQIQGAADPNQSPADAQERLAEVFALASDQLELSGWEPQ